MNYNKMIDHTYLKPEATEKEINKLIDEAKKYGFKTVCVNSSW
ncbi:deoxyribose-phosphate aldolase, partial [Mycoplasmopsis edwardii]